MNVPFDHKVRPEVRDCHEDRPGKRTWNESRIDCVRAVRTVARLTSCEAPKYLPANSSSPPRPLKTRSPTTVSAAIEEASDLLSLSTLCRRSKGRMTGMTASARERDALTSGQDRVQETRQGGSLRPSCTRTPLPFRVR